jgi:hypothetical protein
MWLPIFVTWFATSEGFAIFLKGPHADRLSTNWQYRKVHYTNGLCCCVGGTQPLIIVGGQFILNTNLSNSVLRKLRNITGEDNCLSSVHFHRMLTHGHLTNIGETIVSHVSSFIQCWHIVTWLTSERQLSLKCPVSSNADTWSLRWVTGFAKVAQLSWN